MMEKENLRKISRKLSADKTDYMTVFRENLFTYVDDKDITLTEIADKAGIPLSTLNSFLYGNTSDPKLSTVVKLSRALEISIDELIGAETITDKQREILEYIKKEILNRGYPPTVRDICEAVNLKSTSSVHSHLETLEKIGYIRRDPTKPRAIDIIDEEFALTRRELVNVPIVGTVAAGEPILATENITDYFPIPPEFLHNTNKQTFILKVKGESMINIGINN